MVVWVAELEDFLVVRVVWVVEAHGVEVPASTSRQRLTLIPPAASVLEVFALVVVACVELLLEVTEVLLEEWEVELVLAVVVEWVAEAHGVEVPARTSRQRLTATPPAAAVLVCVAEVEVFEVVVVACVELLLEEVELLLVVCEVDDVTVDFVELVDGVWVDDVFALVVLEWEQGVEVPPTAAQSVTFTALSAPKVALTSTPPAVVVGRPTVTPAPKRVPSVVVVAFVELLLVV